MPITAGEVAKFITAVVGAAGIAITQGLVQGTTAKWLAIGIAILTAAGVFFVPNASPAPTSDPVEPTEPPVQTPEPLPVDSAPVDPDVIPPGTLGPHGGGS